VRVTVAAEHGGSQRWSFAHVLRAARLGVGLTQEELSERCGLSVRTISYLETGRTRRPFMKTVRLLAAALNLQGAQYEQLCRAAHHPGPHPDPLAVAPEPAPPPAPVVPRPVVPPPVASAPRAPAATVPRQLPACLPHFVGREAELAALSSFLGDHGDHGSAAVAAIIGTAGVGKTALAVCWAHRMIHCFPDGQLYLNLRGFDPVGTPLAPSDSIRILLDALTSPAERIPAALDAQVGLYRSLLAGRRMLIVLDTARDEQQVRPLLPGTGRCVVLVTSRRALIGLATADGARLHALDVLPVEQAVELLTRRLGARWPEGPPPAQEQAVRDITQLCACLPLALSVTAARAAARPDRSLTALARSLRNANERLDALATSDVATNVRAVLSWSARQLSPPATQVFDLLGLHPGPDVSVPAAVSLAGLARPDALDALRELTEMHLLTEHATGRLWMHDLLRAYAAERAHALNRARSQAAVNRMLGHYTRTARAASALLNPFRAAPDGLPGPAAAAGKAAAAESLDSYQDALSWFDAEWRVLVLMIRLAADRECHACAWYLSWAIADYLDWRGRWRELAGTQEVALAAAVALGDESRQADAHRTIARAAIQLASFDDAGRHLSQALRLYGRVGRSTAAGRVLLDLGRTCERQGDYRQALGHGYQALRLLRHTGDRAGQANALNNIGWCHANLGDAAAALTYCRQALALDRELGDQQGEAATLDSVGYAHHQLGQYAEAIGYFRHSARLYAELGNRFKQAEPLAHLGDALHAHGCPQDARNAWHDALAILDDLGHPDARLVQVRLRQLAVNGLLPASQPPS
jgi:tetratricopeptide (TPR) repeat protein/DNA-binding XRE family transcriptional regulator